uniref:carboxypeptidase regulatory-like domain-containing protein n=1 Tax=Candidatus Limisoma sp. TaxID=3076476 RepID=UPI003FEFF933
GVEIYVSNPESGADVMTGTTDENGAFALKFKQLGTYNVLFKAAGYDMVSSEEVPFEGNFDITVEMQKTVRTFSGTVTDAESHAAIAGASVSLYKGENKVAEATTGADGSFEIKVKDLAVFSLVVKAEGYEDFTFDTIDLTEGDMTDTPIEMTPNSGVGMLTADGLRVYGTVGAVVVERASEATVRVYNAAGSLVRRADVAGKTRIEGLQRGVYIVNGVKVIVK